MVRGSKRLAGSAHALARSLLSVPDAPCGLALSLPCISFHIRCPQPPVLASCLLPSRGCEQTITECFSCVVFTERSVPAVMPAVAGSPVLPEAYRPVRGWNSKQPTERVYPVCLSVSSPEEAVAGFLEEGV